MPRNSARIANDVWFVKWFVVCFFVDSFYSFSIIHIESRISGNPRKIEDMLSSPNTNRYVLLRASASLGVFGYIFRRSTAKRSQNEQILPPKTCFDTVENDPHDVSKNRGLLNVSVRGIRARCRILERVSVG